MASNNSSRLHSIARSNLPRERGVSLVRALVGLVIVAIVGITAAKVVPAYTEAAAVKKLLKSMEEAGETKGSVLEIRRAFERRNVIEGVSSVTADDLDITKEGREVVITATWSKKIPIGGNLSFCLDFVASNRN